MIIKIDKGTLLKGQPITPGWYKGFVAKVGPHEVQGDRVDGKIELGFDDPVLKADSRTVDHTFYNMIGKGIGFLVPYIGAVKNTPVKVIADSLEQGQSIDFDVDATAGVKIMFKLTNDQYQGRIINKIETFLPYDSEIPL